MILALAIAAAAPPSAVEQIIATERAFASDTARLGGAYTFREFVAADALAMLPDPKSGRLEVVSAKQRIDSRPKPPKPQPSDLRWWPAFAGASAAGDLGFTTGPSIFPSRKAHGFIFTIWERMPDGSWKFFFDGGPRIDGPSRFKPDDPISIFTPARARAQSPQTALRDVATAEARIAVRAATALVAAYAPFVTERTVLMGSGGQPAIGRESAPAELRRRGRTIRFENLGARAARWGDLVFTYGRALIDGSVQGGYARVWQKTRAGWRLAVDQVQVPEKPPG